MSMSPHFHRLPLLAAMALAACAAPDATAPRTLAQQPLRNSGASLVVTSTNDAGPGSLREAIATAADGATITFDPSLAGQTIDFTTSVTPANSFTGSIAFHLVIDKSLTIDGPANGGITLRGNGTAPLLLLYEPFGLVTATLRNVTLTGSAHFAYGAVTSNTQAVFENVLITGNSVGDPVFNAPGQGLIYMLGNNERRPFPGIRFVNSTISGNSAVTASPLVRVIANFNAVSTLEFDNTTVADNQVSAAIAGKSYLTIKNSIFVRNGGSIAGAAPVNCVDVSGDGYPAPTIAGVNLMDERSCGPVETNLLVADPMLGALASNGGATRTRALLPGSPAIDGGVNCSPTTDQRGIARPQGDACDVGAFEFNAFERFTPTLNPTVTLSRATGVATVTGSLTCTVPGTVTLQVELQQAQRTRSGNVTFLATTQEVVDCDGLAYWASSLKPATGALSTGDVAITIRDVKRSPWFAPASASASGKIVWGRR